MTTAARILAAWLLCGPAALADFPEEGEPLPLVREAYDEVFVLEVPPGDSRGWVRRRAHFIRAGQIVAERQVGNDWHWGHSGGRLLVVWDDYGTCRRAIEFDRLTHAVVEDMPIHTDCGPWWAQGRKMTDLKAPGGE